MDATSANADARRALAIRRAGLILAVHAGRMTATQAAAELGVSRKTWYEWEARGLEAMTEALMDRPPGRPPAPPPDPERRRLETQMEALRRQVRDFEIRDRIRDLMGTAQAPPAAAPRAHGEPTKKKP